MRPQWFATGEDTKHADLKTIPYSQMWADDVYWMPMLLANKPFVGRADFNKEGKMQRWWFAGVKKTASS